MTAQQPVFWSALLALSLAGLGTRLLTGGPLMGALARPLRPWEITVAAGSLLLLAFHCLAMFFAGWVDLVPLLRAPAAAVRSLGTASQVSYWVPAALVLVAVRHVWPPALAVLAVTLAGVGYTMFVPHALWTHLWWIAAAVGALVLVAAGLVTSPARRHPARPG